MNAVFDLHVLVALTAAACAIPGVFLVLRRTALMSDAISHVILFGIVVSFFIVRDLDSPWLFAGAAASGVLTVAIVEALQRSKLVREDAAIGLVFPALFSAAVIAISYSLRNLHLDADAVLMGDPVFAVQMRAIWSGRDWGPRATIVLAAVAIVNGLFVTVFWKELKLTTFDPGLAVALGFMPAALHYALMTLVSITAVAAFDAVGSVLVVALMIAPAATAYLLTDRLSFMVFWALGIGIVGALIGCQIARWADANIAGAAAAVQGALFGMAFLFAPDRGLIAQFLQHRSVRRDVERKMLVVHLANHEGTPQAEAESRIDALPDHLHWTANMINRVTVDAERRGLIMFDQTMLKLTDEGRAMAREVLG